MPNNHQTEEQVFDLGLDVELGNNGTSIFEQFHKDQKTAAAGGGAGAGAGNEGAGAGQGAGDGGDKGAAPGDQSQSQAPAAKETPAGGKPAGENTETVKTGAEEVKFNVDPEKLQQLIKEKNADGTTDKGDGAGDGTDPKATGSLGTFTAIYDHFTSELGYTPLKEGETIDSEEKFIEWQEQNINERAEELAQQTLAEAFTNQKENLPVAQDLFRFLQNGGKIQDFIETRKFDDIGADYLTAVTEPADKKERATKVLEQYHTALGWDRPAIEKTLKNLEAGGQLELMADTVLPQFVKMRENKKAVVEQQAIANKTKTDQEVRTYNESIFKTIDESKEFLSFDISTPKEKQKLKEYMFSPTVDLGNGQKVPQYVVDQQKARANPNYTLLNALTLMNKGLELKNVEKKVENEVKKSLKDKLEQAAAGKKLEQPAAVSTANQAPPKNVLDFDKIEFA